MEAYNYGKRLNGEPVSAGIAIGSVYKFIPQRYRAEEAYCPSERVPAEWSRAQGAFFEAVKELDQMQAMFSEQDKNKAMIFAAHQELLKDEELREAVYTGIAETHYTAEYSVEVAITAFTEMLSMVADPLIAARCADLGDIKNRILRILSGEKEKNLSHLPGPVIVVAKDLLPSDTAMLDTDNTLGIITEEGSRTSHSAIIARSMHIPAVLSVKNAMKETEEGQILVLDALIGSILLEPDKETLVAYEQKKKAYCSQKQETEKYISANPCTSDGVLIELGLNIGDANKDRHQAYADFIGLFRSEFLYMESNHMPTEEEQFLSYRQVLEQAEGKTVTLRTLDIGGDKTLPYFTLPREENPFLGQRALRLCFAHAELLHTQLRAAYRAAAYGNMQIMFPMAGSLEDFRRAKEMALSVKEELCREGKPVPQVPLGVMIEIPAMAMIADLIAQEVDFASVGTNDLCQYMCAADRMNAQVAAYYQCFSPAMVRVLKGVAEAFNVLQKPISVCGEMGGDPMGAMLLIGLGWRKLSMSGSNLAAVKEMICTHTLRQMEELGVEALQCRTEAEVKALLTQAIAERKCT